MEAGCAGGARKSTVTLRLRLLVAGILASLAAAAPAPASSSDYAIWQSWGYYQDAGSWYSSLHYGNVFYKSSAGYDTVVTFIDNTGYDWHATVRNSYTNTSTHWYSAAVKRAYCRSYSSGFFGKCTVFY